MYFCPGCQRFSCATPKPARPHAIKKKRVFLGVASILKPVCLVRIYSNQKDVDYTACQLPILEPELKPTLPCYLDNLLYFSPSLLSLTLQGASSPELARICVTRFQCYFCCFVCEKILSFDYGEEMLICISWQ